MNYCNKCGNQLVQGAKFCSKCGSKIGLHSENDAMSTDLLKQDFEVEDNKEYNISGYRKINSSSISSLLNLSQEEFRQLLKSNSTVINATLGFFFILFLILVPSFFRSPKEIVFLNPIQSLYVNEQYRLNITTDMEDYDTSGFIWKSSNDSVVSVNEGVVVGKSEGIATISIESNKGIKNEIQIEVKYNPITDLKLSGPQILFIGDNNKIIVEVIPLNASEKEITFKSNNESIATIDNQGNISAKSKGKVIITASSKDGMVREYEVQIYHKIESMQLSKESVEVKVGNSTNITATILPKLANDVPLTWISSDEKIATVVNGEITAISSGKAVITVKAGDNTKEVNVLVQRKSPISLVNFRYTKNSVGGIEWNFRIRNNTSKSIDYITFTWYNFNGVGDFVYDDVSGRNYTKIRYTGSLKASTTTSTQRNTTLFYNHAYKSSVVYEVIVEYSDGTKETIDLEGMMLIYDLEVSR